VFDDDGDAVGFRIDRAEEVFVAGLRKRAFRILFVIAKRVQGVFEIVWPFDSWL
jgi:hypothetical protein